MYGIIRKNALAWADIVVEGTFFLLQTYLTGVWKLSFTDAAAFLNIWGGIYRILPIFLVFLARNYSSRVKFLTLGLSGIFSTTGLVLITYTAVPGYRCQEKGEAKECVGRIEKAVFITGMLLIGVGRAIRIAFPRPSITDHKDSRPCCGLLGKIFFWILVILFFITPAVTFLAFPYVKKWYILYGVAAFCTALATLSHLSMFRKSVVAASDSALQDGQVPKVNNIVIRMVMLYITCILCGIVSSAGNTYFVQQASGMNYSIGAWKPPLQLLQLIFLAFKTYYYVHFYSQLSTENEGFENSSLMAVLHSVVCCAVAAAVERRRVHAVRRHQLVEQPDDVQTPMSAFWLLFQVCFLGAVEALAGYSISRFHEKEAPESIKRYGDCLSEAVTGLGYMCGALSVYVVGKISERGGAKNWFQFTLNGSRLDRYYWVLTSLNAVYTVVLIVVTGILD